MQLASDRMSLTATGLPRRVPGDSGKDRVGVRGFGGSGVRGVRGSGGRGAHGRQGIVRLEEGLEVHRHPPLHRLAAEGAREPAGWDGDAPTFEHHAVAALAQKRTCVSGGVENTGGRREGDIYRRVGQSWGRRIAHVRAGGPGMVEPDDGGGWGEGRGRGEGLTECSCADHVKMRQGGGRAGPAGVA
jgi:hypothetical protein